jgi:hypothetical protein
MYFSVVLAKLSPMLTLMSQPHNEGPLSKVGSSQADNIQLKSSVSVALHGVVSQKIDLFITTGVRA